MTVNIGNSPGCTPGPKGAVKQHSAMASGYEIPTPKRRVMLSQKSSNTGSARSPGLTNRGK